jgi:hypothetical protein
MICTGVLRMFYFSPRWLPENRVSGTFSQVRRWGGWGSNPRPADYESIRPPLTRIASDLQRNLFHHPRDQATRPRIRHGGQSTGSPTLNRTG